jgi:hypothetical protein
MASTFFTRMLPMLMGARSGCKHPAGLVAPLAGPPLAGPPLAGPE